MPDYKVIEAEDRELERLGKTAWVYFERGSAGIDGLYETFRNALRIARTRLNRLEGIQKDLEKQ